MRSSIIDPRLPDEKTVQAARNLLRALGYCLFFDARQGWKAMSLEGLPQFIDDDLVKLVQHVGRFEWDNRQPIEDEAEAAQFKASREGAVSFAG